VYKTFIAAVVAGLFLLSAAPGRAEPPAALGELTGDVIWVDFWASWCAPCRRSFPWLNAMRDKYGSRGLQIIGVNVDKDRSLADEFLNETPAGFDIAYDPQGELAESFEVQAMPSSFLLDRSGNILVRHYGFKLASTEEYEQSIETALAGRSGSN
jgi:thiol-disulfide isomerase/thioredoxin